MNYRKNIKIDECQPLTKCITNGSVHEGFSCFVPHQIWLQADNRLRRKLPTSHTRTVHWERCKSKLINKKMDKWNVLELVMNVISLFAILYLLFFKTIVR
ncbi:hypothetical protein BZG01_19070 [Labilibaculum manganireducens]|uniref:Uncharacterized protein n=1 Tax=Labilibaculum manganireducens TaxID=1940525 RepID=A0A2N3HTW6_9BACT|nr:hypothetical protein BZG01_19070 [Labilibaculum manganireducens]